MSAPQSQRSLDSRGEPGLGQVPPSAGVSKDPQPSGVLQLGTLLCNLLSLAQSYPMALGRAVPDHAHLSPRTYEPFSSAAPFPEFMYLSTSPPATQVGGDFIYCLHPQWLSPQLRTPHLDSSPLLTLLPPPPYLPLSG